MLPAARAVKIMGLALCALFISGCKTPSQAHWDAKVKEMCEKDGGVTVIEKVALTQEEYKEYGGISGVIPVPGEDSSVASRYAYLSKNIDTEINSSDPVVKRSEYVIYRKSDNGMLGKMVTYSRVGGDIPTGLSAASYFSCADLKTIRLDVEKQIFSVKGE